MYLVMAEVVPLLTRNLTQSCGTLYNVFRRPLAMKSGFFASLLDLSQPAPGIAPGGKGPKAMQEYAKKHDLDGMSDEKALVLPDNVHAADLDHLIHFIFNLTP